MDKLSFNHYKEMNLHQQIKLVRLSKNLTQLYIAEELGIDAASYSRMERGETQITVERLIKVAKVLDVNVSSFLESQLNSSELLEEILAEVKQINKKLNESKIN